jgi:hypothetical protein
MAANSATRLGLIQALRSVWGEVLAWYGRSDDPVLNRLMTRGLITSGPDTLRTRLRSRVADVLREAGLDTID